MKDEIDRRRGATTRVLELFQSRPWTWIAWTDLAAVGGQLAWRSRCADARRIVEREGGVIRWNGNVKASAYRFEPQAPIGRAADVPTVQPSFW